MLFSSAILFDDDFILFNMIYKNWYWAMNFWKKLTKCYHFWSMHIIFYIHLVTHHPFEVAIFSGFFDNLV